MKVTPITPIYRPKFNIKKEPFIVREMTKPIRIDFVEAEETEEVKPPIAWQSDDKKMYISIAIMISVVLGLFLLAMWALRKGYII